MMSSNKNPREPVVVNVMVSTYNGAKYVSEQLDSLLSQDYKNMVIYIRDDGSTDNTISLLVNYQKRNSNIILSRGKNVGVIASFFEMLKYTSQSGELYAFCDQDDVWLPDKISRAVKMISQHPSPQTALYCSRLNYVDKNLKNLGVSLCPYAVCFENAIVENSAVGCTTVFGEEIKKLILRGNPKDMMMHDWWGYLVATAFGHVLYDPEPSILYRQHGNNVAGWEPLAKKIWNRSVGFSKRFLSGKRGLDSLNQAVRFIETYAEISDEKKKLVEELVKLREKGRFFERLNYVSDPKVFRNNRFENLILKPLILLGWH